MMNALALKLIAGTAAILMLFLLIQDRNRWKDTATLRQQQVVAEKAAHASTVANYRAAAEQARAADAANVARVKAKQAAINERTAHAYEARIAAARAHADRLRQPGAAQANSSGGGTAPVPGISPASGGAAQAAGEDGLSPDDALTATEQAIQLDELIQWVRRQADVEVSR